MPPSNRVRPARTFPVRRRAGRRFTSTRSHRAAPERTHASAELNFISGHLDDNVTTVRTLKNHATTTTAPIPATIKPTRRTYSLNKRLKSGADCFTSEFLQPLL